MTQQGRQTGSHASSCTIQKDGEPWFVLKDVCSILRIGNAADVYNRLDEDEKGVGQIDTLGGSQRMNIINESCLYNVILRSDKPEAKPFRKWVTSEVLPAIRKHGAETKRLRGGDEWLMSRTLSLWISEARTKLESWAGRAALRQELYVAKKRADQSLQRGSHPHRAAPLRALIVLDIRRCCCQHFGIVLEPSLHPDIDSFFQIAQRLRILIFLHFRHSFTWLRG